MKSKEYWIKNLDLKPHPEGGYYKEILKSTDTFNNSPLYTSIYFLLDTNSPSHLHSLISDEVWYFHDGSPLTVQMIDTEGNNITHLLGPDIENGHVLQACVPKHYIFGSEVEEDYALVSCMVAPGFSFEDFKLYTEDELLMEYPQHTDLIKRLTLKVD